MGDDILMWADGTWCFRYELSQMNHLSDDFEVIPFDSERHDAILNDTKQSSIV